MSDEPFEVRMERLGDLLEEVERSGGPVSLDVVRALVRAVLDVHEGGLEEILRVARDPAHGGSERLSTALAANPRVASLLLYHDLHPEPVEARVGRAIALAMDRAGVDATAELRRVNGAQAFVRIAGGTSAARAVLQRTLLGAMDEFAPDAAVVVEGVSHDTRSDLIPAARLVLGHGGTG